MKFETGTVLSCITGILLCDDIGKVYKILNYMTGDNLYTHQLPNACRFCKPYLIEQHPWLTECHAEDITKENCEEYLAGKVKEHGATMEVQPLPEGAWTHINPLTELLGMINGKKEAK